MMQQLGIAGAWQVSPAIHTDRRGSFREWFRADEFAAITGYRFSLAQANCSVSHRGVIRGIHFADVPPGQAKYVVCMSGSVLDVIVDVRVGSPTFGRWVAVQLDTARRGVFISEGLGHAFISTSAEATVVYLCSEPYSPASERAVNPLDPAIAIDWPANGLTILSDKDRKAPSLAEAQRDGLLPSYPACVEYVASLKGTP